MLRDESELNVYKTFEEEFISLYKEYSFLNITLNSYRSLVLSEIKKIKRVFKSSEEYKEYLVNRIKIYLNNYIKGIINDSKDKLSVINSFINYNFSGVLNYNKAVYNIERLLIFINEYNIKLDMTELFQLVEGNKVLSENLKSIYKENNGVVSYLKVDDEGMQILSTTLINIYVTLNENLEINGKDTYKVSDIYDNKLPLLTKDEEISLSRFINGNSLEDTVNGKLLLKREGNTFLLSKDEAYELFINSNIPLVVSICKMFVNNGLEFEDLMQEGIIGLMVAVKKFDYQKGYRFSTYAVLWIRETIIRALANSSRTIRLPYRIYNMVNKYRGVLAQLRSELQREATIEEISKVMNISIRDVQDLQTYANSNFLFSINAPIRATEDDKHEFADFIIDDADMQTKVELDCLKNDIQQLFKDCFLSEKEIFILNSIWGLNDYSQLSYSEVGEILKVSRQRVQQIEYSALYKVFYYHPKKMLKFISYALNPDEARKTFENIKTKIKKNKNPLAVNIRRGLDKIDRFEGSEVFSKNLQELKLENDRMLMNMPKELILTFCNAGLSIEQMLVLIYYWGLSGCKKLSLKEICLRIYDDKKNEMFTINKIEKLKKDSLIKLTKLKDKNFNIIESYAIDPALVSYDLIRTKSFTKSIYMYFPDYSIKQVNYIISKLSKDDISLLYECFDVNSKKIIDNLKLSSYRKVYPLIKEAMGNMLFEEYKTKILETPCILDINKIDPNSLDKSIIQKVCEGLTSEEINIIEMYLGFNKYAYTMEQIVILTAKASVEVKKILESFILNYNKLKDSYKNDEKILKLLPKKDNI